MKLVRTLDRYVAREFLRLFLLATIAVPVLFILGDLMDNLDKHMERGRTVGQLVRYYLFQSPLFIQYSFPIASLLATVFTVNNMTRHSEVAAAKAGGISFFRAFAAIPTLGVILTVLGLGLAEVVPVGIRKASETLGETSRSNATRTDFVYRTAGGDVFSIRRLDARRQRMNEITMEREGDEPETPSVHMTAREAVYSPETGWTVRDGQWRVFYGEGNERAFRFDSMLLTSLTEAPEDLLARPRDPEEMRYAELGRFIEILRRSGGRPLELMVERAQKIALPVATLVIVLFAMPLATSSRRGGSAFGVGVSLAITIVYLMLFKIAGAAGASGALPPTVSAWIPNGVFLAAAVVLMTRVKT